MWIQRRYARAVAMLIAPSLLVCVTVQTTQAAMIATEQVVESAADCDAQAAQAARTRLHEFFEREDVEGILVDWGVDAVEAKARVDAMTDAEVASVAGRLDAMPAGGSAVGAVVGAVVLIFLVLLITDLLGLTDVFPFVRKHR